MKRVKERAAALVALDLRSVSVVLTQMRGLIVEAHRLGHSHKAIHASLEAAGLRASWNTYKSCLVRMKKVAQGLPAGNVAETVPPAALGSTCTAVDVAPPAKPVGRIAKSGSDPALTAPARLHNFTPFVDTASSATRVLNALNEARKAATSRDYVQVSRDLQRQQQRAQRSQRIQPKDRS